jgi:LEA14-like dessication related protein
MRYARPILVLLPVLLLVGCASIGRRPEVNLVDVRLGQIGLLETAVVFTVRITNDNPVGMTIDDGLYEFFVEGVQVGRGRLAQPLVVPRHSSELQHVTLHLNNLQLLQQIRSAITTGSFNYRIDAQHFVRGMRNRPFTSTSEGRFELRDRSAAVE